MDYNSIWNLLWYKWWNNGTLAINATPTQEDFLKVGGQTTIQDELRCENKIK